jgi:HlyD family secretion protein
MKPRAIIAPILLLTAVCVGFYIDRTRAASENLITGSFENQPTLAASRIGGRVSHILVKEGDEVRAGEPIVELENAAFASTVRGQHAAAIQAQEQSKETIKGPRPEEIAKQQAAADEAKANYQKLVNGPLPEDIRSARDKLAQARAAYGKALAGPRKQEIDAARAADHAAEAKLREAQNGLTQEERNELAARLSEAQADELLCKKKLDRDQYLYNEDAISAQDLDIARSDYDQAVGRRKDAENAVIEAAKGTRPEEIAQDRELYRQAHANLELELAGSRPEDIESTRQDVKVAQESLNLLLRGSRQEDIDAAKAHWQGELESLEELQRGNRIEDIAKQKAAHREAILAARSAAENLKETVIYSPFNGRVDRVLVADGDLMQPNAPVVQLSQPDDIWIRVYIAERQLRNVKVSDRAELQVDGIPGTVAAYVESIDTEGQFTPANLQAPEERGNQVFGVKLRLVSPDPRVKPGMYATVKQDGPWK